jgi:hypothetical protein
MATTPSGLYYPGLSDAPNGPSQMQQLAQSADTKVIPAFATAAARNAAITAPTDGQPTYRQDTNTIEVWNGAAWDPFRPGPTFQTLLFAPGANADTPGSGTATWVTLGNVTVPLWATQCFVTYTMNGIFDTGTTASVTVVMKIGSVSGSVTKRLLSPGVATQRFHQPITDVLTGLSTGSQSVTLSAGFGAGTVVRADATSFFTALFAFSA